MRRLRPYAANTGSELRWREITPPTSGVPRLNLRELWDYRDLAFILAKRELQLTYRQTLLGVAWVVLQPLVGTIVFSVVFGQLAQLPSDGVPYAAFVLTGLTVWMFVSGAVSSAADSLVHDRDLVTKVYFPRLLAPLGAVLACTVELFITLMLLIPVLAITRVVPPLQVITVPLWMLAAVLLAVAVGLWLAASNVLYRDVQYLLGFLLQIWLFVSPVAFSSSLVPERWRWAYFLNPAAGVIDGMRWAVLDTPWPGRYLAISAAALLVILVGGVGWFNYAEQTFADAI